MDRSKARAGVLIAGALLLAADAPSALPLTEARWLAPQTPIDRLLYEPAECVAWPAAPPLHRSAQIGRAAFRAPLLLGGQAARAGLSCASCHRNGRGNPDFHFPGISGKPGTADVTASLLSSHRGDGAFNPRSIPDLANIAKPKERRDLEVFIRGLIVEEFDGPEPDSRVLRGLIDYVRFMDSAECDGDVPISLASALEDVDRTVQLAKEESVFGRRATASFLLAAARSGLGRIDERFTVPGLESERRSLSSAAVHLGTLRNALGGSNERGLWRKWSTEWAVRKRALIEAEPRSLYSAAVLREHSAARRSSRD